MNVKKGLIAGVGAVMLLGGAYGVSSVYADSTTSSHSASVTAEAHAGHLGKGLTVLNKYKTQIHQVNQLKVEHLDLQKQILEKRDKLMDLVIAAKESGNKEKLKQAQVVRKQINDLKKEMKPLLKTQHSDAKALKQALKNGKDASEQFKSLITVQRQINEKMKQEVSDLDKLLTILK
ncbi:hypothetical protein [Neobacillus fumarioli]|uniref:hypothetical protein n=1 Tax=Neobacillus fumarioli TaxID=105229 RepID=UPI00082E93EA|nr:hypothetical protein [Neobacillus fumarioli]